MPPIKNNHPAKVATANVATIGSATAKSPSSTMIGPEGAAASL
jgi:hypothetical protein